MNTRCLLRVATLLVIFLAAPMIPAEEEPGPVTLTGVVTVHEETEEGEIQSIYLADTERGSVLISKSGLWEELLDYVDQEIEATGTLAEAGQAMFRYAMTVTSFSPTEGE